MRARILSPIEEAKGVVGVVWLDCDFENLPKQTDLLNFLPQGKNTQLRKIIQADKNISPADIDFILVTSMVSFTAGSLDAKHSADLIAQGWRREVEENGNWPANADEVGVWMAKVDLYQPAFMASWARAVATKRDSNAFRCNQAELFNGSWQVKLP
jgi:hypothetical protein